ncbi:putative acetyltransferase [Actinomyces bovis]|uniref:Acetyltransferase n=1 Tax=Actinomyces bovis TaxID=1658 RepID=A0ABY1VK09_9ACTO|nr:GNAT family N-acetyltransferase [Actinomyces bovis]SPT52444.1 putative acetyltransferase [Actinomyces bovis]VEG54098.1 putative acetyltransferase [Actinomyces israelii]
MAPFYGSEHHARTGIWSMLRPGPRSALPSLLHWSPLSMQDNPELAALIARAEAVDNPPYRTSEAETAEYFIDPTYSGVAGRDADGVMRGFGLVRLRPAGEVYASMTGVVDPEWRERGIGGALLRWQAERARHLIGIERAAQADGDGAQVPAHVVTTVLADDERMKEHLASLGLRPLRWYQELRRPLSQGVPEARLGAFLSVEPWTEEIDDAVLRAHNLATLETQGEAGGAVGLSPEEWAAGRTHVEPSWCFVVMDRSGDRARVAGYLRSARFEQDWEALGWREGYTDMLGVLAEYRGRDVGRALLAAAMHAYAADGMDYAAAGVDSDNPTGAVSLYEELGYLPTRGTILYGMDV